MISCTLSVDNIQSEAGFIEAGSFIPEPPIILGQAILYNGTQVRNICSLFNKSVPCRYIVVQVDSFVGCITLYQSIEIPMDLSMHEC